MITLDLRSDNSSIDPLSEAETITLIVSWNDAADNQESVSLAIFVNHNANLFPLAGFLPSSSNCLLILMKSSYFAYVPGMKLDSPESSINTLENNCLITTSICLSFKSCPCAIYTFLTSLMIYLCVSKSPTMSLYSLASKDPLVRISHLKTSSPFLFLSELNPRSGLVYASWIPRTIRSLCVSSTIPSSFIFNLLFAFVAYTAHFTNVCHFLTSNV